MIIVIDAGHQPAADHILERFEIFPWFDGSINLQLQRCAASGLLKQVLSCRACFSFGATRHFVLLSSKICAEIS